MSSRSETRLGTRLGKGRGAARLVDLAERGALPDAAIRLGIRRLVGQRLASESRGGPAARQERFEALVAALGRAPVAVATRAANEQHYEVPAALYRSVLGSHLKYSSCLWPPGVRTLDEAERRMLDLTVRRAGIADGQEILELGCGWGSLTLRMAEAFQGSRITAVSNSASQRRTITERCRERGLANVEVITADVNHLELDRTFDRVVSVEMLEHVRNHRALFERIAGWLRPGGTFFAHVFCHRSVPYLFDEDPDDPGDWMARTFFTGGIMPSPDLFLRFQDHLRVRRQWLHDGHHYQRTAEAWLRNLDRNRSAVRRVLAAVHGGADADRWVQRWRIFFMAVAELFGYRGGREWLVCHTLFERPPAPRAETEGA
jgi:cyclopropane-fatty-acyl-phospholipid synthase